MLNFEKSRRDRVRPESDSESLTSGCEEMKDQVMLSILYNDGVSKQMSELNRTPF